MKEKQIKFLETICDIFSFIGICIIIADGIALFILNKLNVSETVSGILIGIAYGATIILVASLIIQIIVKKKIAKEAEPKPKTFAETLFEENKEAVTKLKDPAEYDLLVSEFNREVEIIKKDIKEKISKAIKTHPECQEVRCETLPVMYGKLKLYSYKDRKDIDLDIRNILEDYLVKELGFNKYKNSYLNNILVICTRTEIIPIKHGNSVIDEDMGDIFKVIIYDWRPSGK